MAITSPHLTRFAHRTLTNSGTPSTIDGPVSGAIQTYTFAFDAIIAGETDTRVLQLPTGMTFEITNVSAYTGAVGAAGALLEVGTVITEGQIVASVAIVAGVVQHTIVEGTVGAAGTIFVQIIGGASTGTVAIPIGITITGYVSSAPTVLRQKTGFVTNNNTATGYR